ncbi:S-layer homology domain-containing protein [Alkalihalobacillus oceani]|uniref:S-layer homology domain-containing protein n=1 Tax=Halalkalibacter oceani TaxID=1653776 RepID=A0A9X2DQN6_9BACI|nr:S-layer homology domain-containing protein [Halalkalibacter oceani]MCM3714708.1 S-layer homology domain-containing protein [Halalkalibacter oceani]
MKIRSRQKKWLKQKFAATMSALLVASGFFAAAGPVAAADGVTGISTSTGATNYVIDNAPVIIDEEVSLNIETGTLEAVTVSIDNAQAGDTLDFDDSSSLFTGHYDPSSAILTITGNGATVPTAEQFEAALQSVTFSTDSEHAGERTITFGLGSALPFSENGHFYEFVDNGSSLTWYQARDAASESDYFGLQGYLVTITDEDENEFIKGKTQGLGWIGAKDISRGDDAVAEAERGDWRWVTGPEGEADDGKGTPFYLGYDGEAEAGPVPGAYNNWATGEPNDSSGREYVAHIYGPGTTNHGYWNDFPIDNSVTGYIVEYGGADDDPVVTLSATKTIEVEAPANVQSPGGISDGLTSWVEVEKSANVIDGIVTDLDDLADERVWSSRVSPPEQRYEANTINFNPGVTITAATGFYETNRFGHEDEAREIFSVQARTNPDRSGYPWNFGGIDADRNHQYGVDIDGEQHIRAGFSSTEVRDVSVDGYDLFKSRVLNIQSATNHWSLALDGQTLEEYPSNEVTTNTSSSSSMYYIGGGHYQRFDGSISEVILFNRVLEDEERQQVNSYLALKYGLTLPDDYVASDGSTTMWTKNENVGYGHRITGIGRDDASGLVQKQSQSQETGALVTVALGDEIALSNSANTNNIARDLSFFTFSDDNGAAEYNTAINKDDENVKRLDRVFKVEKTNNWADTQITLQADALEGATTGPQYLVVNNGSSFASGNNFYPLTDGEVTINSSILTDGRYFTFAAPVPAQTGSVLQEADEIAITFDREVTVVDTEGFTVTVDGTEITGATVESDPADPAKLLVKLPAGTDATGKEVTISYDGLGNVKGTNGVAVDDFTVIVGGPLRLEHVSVADRTPNEATLTFNQVVAGDLDVNDFIGFVIDGKQVTEVKSINGREVVVRFAEPFAPEAPLVVEYDDEAGSIVAADDPTNELGPISAADQSGITKENEIIPLEVVTTYIQDGKLKVIFNKEVASGDDLDLSGLQLGGAPVLKPYEVNGNMLTVALPVDYQPGDVLTYSPGNIKEVGNGANKLQPFTEADAFAVPFVNPGGRLTNAGFGLMNGADPIEVEPAEFTATIPGGYSARVPHSVSSISLSPEAVNEEESIVVVQVNGTTVDDFDRLPLRVGENVITVGIYDKENPHVLLGYYEVIVTRAGSSSGGGNGGSGGSGGSGGGNGGGTPGPVTEIIEVDVIIGGDNEVDITKAPIERTTHRDGTISDHVTFTEEKAEEAIEKAIEAEEQIVRIVIPDQNDEVSEVLVDVPRATVALLQENGIDLEIFTENATIQLPHTSLEGIDEDFFFRLVPVKDRDEREEIEERARVEQVVRAVAGDRNIEVVARPKTIETNLSSRPVVLTLPLRDVELPEDEAERAVFLQQLGIFIEHSDGDKEVVRGTPVTMQDGTLGLQFSVEKFSTFTIIHFLSDEAAEGLHHAYIQGFQDGEFKPSRQVTRAQLAVMIARNLDYDEREWTGLMPYEDVPDWHYAAGEIAFVHEKGIMTGDQHGDFRANDRVTRAEMATVVANYRQLAIERGSSISFSDTAGHWAADIIEANRTAGIINGYQDGSFKPNGGLTRAEAVVMINGMFERGPLYGINDSSFPDVANSHWAFAHIEEAARTHYYLLDEDGHEQIVE